MSKKSWLWRYTVRVCRRPRSLIVACAALALTCSLGLLRVQVITNPDLIWVPPNSLANRQKEFFGANFSPFFRVNQVFFVAKAPTDGIDGDADMIQAQYLQRVMSVQRAIELATFTLEKDGVPRVASLDDVCFKPIEGEGCLIESPSQYWLNDPVLLAKDGSPSLTATCQTTEPFLASRSPCMDKIGTPVMREVVFGDIGINSQVVSPDPCGGLVPAAGALVLTFLLNNYADPSYQRLAEQWEKEVFLPVVEEARDLLANDIQAPMQVSYMAQRSVEDSLSVEAGENAWVLAVSYVLMFVYVSIILGDPCDAVRSRFSLALTGIVIVIASLGTSIGLLSAAGVGTTLIVWEVVPFLTLAIGVDNMVILSREFDRLEAAPEFEPCASTLDDGKEDVAHEGASGPTFSWATSGALVGSTGGGSINRIETPESRLEDRMGAAVCKVAPSILGAAVCETVAFLVGALTDIPALRQFCLVAATAVAVGFVFQVTWFMAALSLDMKRVSQKRLDVAPWLTRGVRRDRKPWGAAEDDQVDPVNGGLQSVSVTVPLLSEEGIGQTPGQRTSSSPLSHRSPLAPRNSADGGATSSSSESDSGGERANPSRGVRESLVPVGSDLTGRVNEQRSFTSEFGSASDANPALFPSTKAPLRTARDHRARPRRRPRGPSGEVGGAKSYGGEASRTTGKDAGSVRERVGTTDGRRPRRGGSRRWFDDPNNSEDDHEHARTAHDPSNELRGAKGSPKKSDAGMGATAMPPPATTEPTAVGHPRAAGHVVLGGHVVEGYVSLGPSLRRRGSGDDEGGSLLLAGPPDDGEVADTFCGGSGFGQSMSTFREQLYEEGRRRGNLASRLLDRYYLPALLSRGGKIATLAVAAGLAVLGSFGLARLRMGLEPQLAAPTDFYLQDYYEAQFSMGEAGPPAYVVMTDVDYFRAFNDSEARQAFNDLTTGLAQLQRYVQAPIYSWFDTMIGWVHQRQTLGGDCPPQVAITDESSFYSMAELFLSIPIESQCCQSYGICGAQFATDVAFDTVEGVRRVVASRLRFNMQPLEDQQDYVNSYYYMKVVTDELANKIPERYKGQREANKAVGNLAFPYSLYFVFYEQYAFIQGVALQNVVLALAVVFLSIGMLSRFAIAWIVTSMVLATTLGTVGLVWAWGELSPAPYSVSINAVSVCNLVMSLGLSVEFCLHVAIAFQSVPGTRQERAEAAMRSAGASVLTGITLTKLVGVSVLAIAPSLLFRIYYFRMYMATVVAGAFQGLAVLPVLLSMCGPKAPPRVRPREASWADVCGDKHPSPLRCSEDHTEGGYYDLGAGTPWGAESWQWAQSDTGVQAWDPNEETENGMARGGLVAMAPAASHVRLENSAVL